MAGASLLTLLDDIAMWLVGGSLITHGVHAMHSYIIIASEFVAQTPILGNILAAITPLFIDLIVGFTLGALLVFIELAFKKTSKV